ncbi:MAG: antibiotic biosynthesis monooxygenase [Rhizobium sp.]|nr:antibiotic biosynthesis monooxygenase [Rhizobium sp.]
MRQEIVIDRRQTGARPDDRPTIFPRPPAPHRSPDHGRGPGRRGDEARKALLELRKATLPEPGCAEFEFFQSLADERAFVLIEDFADEAALARHMEEPHTRAFFALNLLERAAPVGREWLA